MSWNPFEDSTKKDERAAQDFALDLGLVVGYIDEEEKHQVIVRVLSPETFEPISAPEPVDITVNVRGDITVPKKNTVVVIGYIRGKKPVILDSLYTRQDEKPDPYEGTDRVVGSPYSDAEVRFKEDGSIFVHGEDAFVELQSNGDVVINQGTTRPVTDVSTTTDADGHVTSISLTRSDTVYIPE